jgi:predicted alpha/beta-hydrolase family hydrolase
MKDIAFLLAPGAGASSTHPRMLDFAKVLARVGAVQAFDYPYMVEGRKLPDRLPKLIAAHREAAEALKARHNGPVVLVGKSLGGRVGCHVSLETKVSAIICLGYPLCGGGNHHKLRDAVLRDMTTPVLFVQGTRDVMCPLELLSKAREPMQAANALYVVQGGDHSLLVTKSQLKQSDATQDIVDISIAEEIRRFVEAII